VLYPSAAKVWRCLMGLLDWPMQRAGIVTIQHLVQA
jgi:hypothetical protein